MQEIGIGMLGCGWMGQIHARNLAAIPGVRIAAAYDYSFELASQLVSTLGGTACATPEEVYTAPGVDAVYICTRHDVRHELFELSLEYMKPTFCEKPLAMTVEEAIWVTEAVQKAGILFSMGFNQRFKAGIRALRQRMDTIAMQPTAVSLSYASGGFLNCWSGLPEIGGGILTCLGSHVLDLCRYLVGDKVESVSCFADRQRFPDPYLEDMAVINMRFANGAIAALSVNDHACPGYKQVTKQHLTHLEVFSRGRVLALNGCDTVVEAVDNDLKRHKFDPGDSFEQANGYSIESEAFIEQLRSGRLFLPTVLDGLEAVRLVEAARKSAHSGKVVSMTEIPGL
ncbi:MAG: Gfo/Idh/MocA family oxidoreductase [Firmicutes bacterium]|jgi:myo-inositol 2-dehydrogenase/D-chiro-inositol 1-dehydrogenase|nr:Gfo/Idh/MocA family oxidoreductase [Bacillota bacterium]